MSPLNPSAYCKHGERRHFRQWPGKLRALASVKSLLSYKTGCWVPGRSLSPILRVRKDLTCTRECRCSVAQILPKLVLVIFNESVWMQQIHTIVSYHLVLQNHLLGDWGLPSPSTQPISRSHRVSQHASVWELLSNTSWALDLALYKGRFYSLSADLSWPFIQPKLYFTAARLPTFCLLSQKDNKDYTLSDWLEPRWQTANKTLLSSGYFSWYWLEVIHRIPEVCRSACVYFLYSMIYLLLLMMGFHICHCMFTFNDTWGTTT